MSNSRDCARQKLQKLKIQTLNIENYLEWYEKGVVYANEMLPLVVKVLEKNGFSQVELKDQGNDFPFNREKVELIDFSQQEFNLCFQASHKGYVFHKQKEEHRRWFDRTQAALDKKEIKINKELPQGLSTNLNAFRFEVNNVGELISVLISISKTK